MTRLRTALASLALGAALLTSLSACAPEGTGIGFGVHHNPAVIMPAEYAQVGEAKSIVDDGATAQVLFISGISHIDTDGTATFLARFRITATGAKPFRLDPAAIGYGYGTLAKFDPATFVTTSNSGSGVALTSSQPPLVGVTLKRGEATEGWVAFKLLHTEKPVLLTWSAAGDGKKDVLAVWEDAFSLNE